ncbi:MAG: hypothetical protein AAB461_00320 [Patescibacteria group bacterium]
MLKGMNKILLTLTTVAVIIGVAYFFVIKSGIWPLSKNTDLSTEIKSTEISSTAVVKSMIHSSLGNYLTDGMGNTLYVYGKDEPFKSSCEDDCAQKWVPYYANFEEFRPSDDLLEKRINLIRRTDGSHQYAYGEKPLYYYYQDGQSGDINGNNINELWSIILTDSLNQPNK